MEKTNSNWCTFLILVAQITAFIPFGINLTILNPSTPSIKAFINESYQLRFNISSSENAIEVIFALTQSFLLVGTAVGVFFVQQILKHLSRRNALLFAHLLMAVSYFLMSPVTKLAWSYEALLIGRLVCGFSRGVLFIVIPLYVAEISNRKSLAVYQSLTNCFFLIGCALGNVVAHPAVLGGILNWPFALAVPGIFSVAFISSFFMFPETPTYILLRHHRQCYDTENKDDGVKRLLHKLRNISEENMNQEYEQLRQELNNGFKVKNASVLEVFRTGSYRKQLLGATFVQLAAQLAGIQVAFQYTNSIFKIAGVKADEATLYSFGLLLLMAMFAFLSSTLAQSRYGSKKVSLFGTTFICVGLTLLITATSLESSVAVPLSIVSFLIYFISLGAGPMTTMHALPSEITIQRTRSAILWISGICFWLFGTVVCFTSPFLLNEIKGFTFVIFLIFTLLEVFYIWKYIPDTRKPNRNKFLEELKQIDKSGNSSIKEEIVPALLQESVVNL